MNTKNATSRTVTASGELSEALHQAEMQFLTDDYDKKELHDILHGDDGIHAMAYKDDDGYWRLTDHPGRWDNYEDIPGIDI